MEGLEWELLAKLENYPSKRHNHGSALNYPWLFIYGGSDHRCHLYKIHLITRQCIIIPHNQPPPQSHTLNIVNGDLVAVGGSVGEQVSGEVWRGVVDKDVCHWKKLQTVPEISGRKNHSATALPGDSILIYGGINNYDEVYDEFWVVNLQLELCLEMKLVEGRCTKRSSCSMATQGQVVYLFGGKHQHTIYNQLYAIRFEHMDFTSLYNLPALLMRHLTPNSRLPPPRHSHASAAIHAGIVVVGGEGIVLADGRQQLLLLNDVWIYQPLYNAWVELQPLHPSPFRGRSGLSVEGDGKEVIVFGGITCLEPIQRSDQLWVLHLGGRQPSSAPPPPTSAYLHMHPSSLSDLAAHIPSPIDALCLLVFALYSLSYTQLNIKYYPHLLTIYAYAHTLTKQQFHHLVYMYGQTHLLSTWLKNACSRMGTGLILVAVAGKQVRMAVVGDDVLCCELQIGDSSMGDMVDDERAYNRIKQYMSENNVQVELGGEDFLGVMVVGVELQAWEHDIRWEGYSAESRLSTYFLDGPELEVRLNGQLLEWKDIKSLSNEPIFVQPSLQIGVIDPTALSPDTVYLYSQNQRVYPSSPSPPAAYVVLPSLYLPNIFGSLHHTQVAQLITQILNLIST